MNSNLKSILHYVKNLYNVTNGCINEKQLNLLGDLPFVYLSSCQKNVHTVTIIDDNSENPIYICKFSLK